MIQHCSVGLVDDIYITSFSRRYALIKLLNGMQYFGQIMSYKNKHRAEIYIVFGAYSYSFKQKLLFFISNRIIGKHIRQHPFLLCTTRFVSSYGLPNSTAHQGFICALVSA